MNEMRHINLYLVIILIVIIALIGISIYYGLSSPLPQNSPTGYPIG